MKKRLYRFSPCHDTSAFFQRKRGEKYVNYNWVPRIPSPFAKDPLNQRTLGAIFSELHHYASHAPEAVAQKWKAAERRFMEQHLPRCSSTRFANKFTGHRWL